MPSLNWIIFKNSVALHAWVWVGTLIFMICGTTFTVIGTIEGEIFLAIGLPILGIGLLVMILAIVSLRISFTQPQNIETFDWWLQFISGITGVLLFSVPSMFALPIVLIIDDNKAWLGLIFSIVGLILTIVISLVGIRMYKKRPRWISKS